MKRVEVWKGSLVEEMYLYVDPARGMADVPEPLLQRFGTLSRIFVIPLTPDRRLARAKAADVLAQIEAVGYYLQMPPPAESSAEAQIAAMVQAETQLSERQNQQPERD